MSSPGWSSSGRRSRLPNRLRSQTTSSRLTVLERIDEENENSEALRAFQHLDLAPLGIGPDDHESPPPRLFNSAFASSSLPSSPPPSSTSAVEMSPSAYNRMGREIGQQYPPPTTSIQRGMAPDPIGEPDMKSYWSSSSSTPSDTASNGGDSSTGLLKKVKSAMSLKSKEPSKASSSSDHENPLPTALQSSTESQSHSQSSPSIQRQAPEMNWSDAFRMLSLQTPNQENLLGSQRLEEVTNWVEHFNYSSAFSSHNLSETTRAALAEDTDSESSVDPDDMPTLMAISTADYQSLAKENFKISDGRFTFLAELKNMDEPFYVVPPPSPANSESGDDEQRPSYFRSVALTHANLPAGVIQFFNVVPKPGQPPKAPVGPTPPTGLTLHNKFSNPLKTDQKVGDYPPGNAAGNQGFHIFLDSEGTSEFRELDTSKNRSDYYGIPFFEPAPDPPVRSLELNPPSTVSSNSDDSDVDMQQWSLKCLPPRQEQTPAQAVILFLHQHGWTEQEIAKKLGPLVEDFLFDKQTSRWYRGARMPDVYGLSMELVDRICEHTAADIKPWEQSTGDKFPTATFIKWRIRDRNVGYLVPKVIENYLYRSLEGLTPHTDVNYF